MTGCVLLAWLKLLALDGDLARAEPKTLRYRLLHSAAPRARRTPQNPQDRRRLALDRRDRHRPGSASTPYRTPVKHHG